MSLASIVKRILLGRPKGRTFHRCTSCGNKFFITSIENLYFKSELDGEIPKSVKNSCRTCRISKISKHINNSQIFNKALPKDFFN